MTTQTQGKGKKKNKEVTKVSLDEFNSFDAPHGHSVISVKRTGLDWAETMADYEQTTTTHQIVVPVAPRAQRGPNVDYELLPDAPPFRASLYGMPMSVEEKEIAERFFQGLNVIRVDISSKTSTTVEFESKQDLYDALCKDGASFKGRTVNVCLFGQAPQNEYDRYGGRGGNSSYGDRNERGQSGGFGSRMGDKYGGGGGGGFGRDRDYGSGFNSGGGGGFGSQQRGGFSDRSQEGGNFRDNQRASYTSGGGEPPSAEPENWRDRPPIVPPPQLPSLNNNGSRLQHDNETYVSRTGTSSYGDRNERGPSGGFGPPRMGDRYGGGGGFGRDRDYGSGFNRASGGGFGSQQRSGFGDRFQQGRNFRNNQRYTSGGGEPPSEEPENWRDRPALKTPPQQPSSNDNGSRQL